MLNAFFDFSEADTETAQASARSGECGCDLTPTWYNVTISLNHFLLTLNRCTASKQKIGLKENRIITF